MSVKKVFYLLLIGLFVLMSGCGSKYDDVIAVNKEFVGAMEDYITVTGEADSAGEIAEAINTYAAKIEELAPKLKETMHKYPELSDNTIKLAPTSFAILAKVTG